MLQPRHIAQGRVTRRLRNSPASQDDVPEVLRLPTLNGFDVHEVSVSDIGAHYDKGHFSCVEYVQFCLNAIRTANPYLEAVIELNPDAVPIAKKLDGERRAGMTRGVLHGIPVLVKDNMATQDSMQTTAGSWALLGSIVRKDAFVVARLRAAGAIVIGHSNMDEWAALRSKDHSIGYSPRGGQTRNPYDLRKWPFGSSSGSAVAVSASLVPIALGTETDTSIIGPAGTNGIVGIKPTVGLTSRAGVIPISTNMDTVGSFGRTVTDAVVCLDAILGPDEDDNHTLGPRQQDEQPYIACLASAEALKGARFGLPIKRCWELVPPACRAIATKILESIRQAGAQIVEVNLPSIEERVSPDGNWDWEHGEPATSEATVAKVDAYNEINAYLANLVASPVRSIEEIVHYNIQNTGTEGGVAGTVPAFPDGQPNLLEVIETKGKRDEAYHAALKHIRRQTRENGIDAALCHTPPGSDDAVMLDALLFCDRRGIGQQYAAQAGYPIVCIPIGLDNNGMPVSLSLQHSAWGEGHLVRWASAIEDMWNRETGWRPTPTFRNLHAKNIPVERID